ncbi:hypothetical protein P3X46_008858 [Hevea brasiliensis]|uniref:Uncharacterized protein n=1 Tax=Hevea brasiliensis TaxID=3981 RepID=A0ABQ9MME9_HEVBR|nr:uncharacterized protein LOC110649000 [Hevea brasiliensis]KAJ9180642.1 hypothetical protein P3X46_008858 [Hevea brasiliensis]
MEGKQLASSSSFTSELFGSTSKDSTSSTGIFGSIFAPPSKVLGRGLLRSEVFGNKQDSANEAWNTKPGAPDDTSKSNKGEGQNMPSRDVSSLYQEQRVQPCHLSSSIYYGGQDIYHHPQNSQSSSMTSMFNKDGAEDDSGSASRGNWWQGSLYY